MIKEKIDRKLNEEGWKMSYLFQHIYGEDGIIDSNRNMEKIQKLTNRIKRFQQKEKTKERDALLSKIREERQLLRDEAIYIIIPHKVILNPELFFNDLAVYFSVSRLTFIDSTTKISSKQITDVCGIEQHNQSPIIKKLEENGLIEVYRSRYESSFSICDLYKNGEAYITLRLDYFNGLKFNVKDYIRRLRGIVLSWGNNNIPSYQNCKEKFNGKLTRDEYKKIVNLYDEFYSDVENYEQLKEY